MVVTSHPTTKPSKSININIQYILPGHCLVISSVSLFKGTKPFFYDHSHIGLPHWQTQIFWYRKLWHLWRAQCHVVDSDSKWHWQGTLLLPALTAALFVLLYLCREIRNLLYFSITHTHTDMLTDWRWALENKQGTKEKKRDCGISCGKSEGKQNAIASIPPVWSMKDSQHTGKIWHRAEFPIHLPNHVLQTIRKQPLLTL